MVDKVLPGRSECSRKQTPDRQKQKEESDSCDPMCKRCTQCSLKFKNYAELRDHMEKKECLVIKCSFCSTLLLKAQLQEHLRQCATKPLPYVCRTCGKSFSQLNALTGHQAVHSGNRGFFCFVCGLAFDCSRKVKEHRKACPFSSMSLTDEPRFPIYRCGECSTAYAKAASLKRHLNHKRHKLSLCGDCGFGFEGFTALCSHIMEAHENWCFSCRKCGKKHVDQKIWNAHVSNCSKNSIYKCHFCILSFKSKSKYSEHVKEAH